MKNIFITLTVLGFAACSPSASSANDGTQPASSEAETAIFAGGCFWCTESDFEKVPGVIEAVSGYTGGHVENPTYKQVTRDDTGHYEAVKVIFDPSQVTYKALVDYYWHTVDPTDPNGQFCDEGSSYRTAIFASPEQLEAAKLSKEEIKQSKSFADPIVTPIVAAATFYDAEDYHQDYYKKNKIRYKFYRNGCGRDKRLEQLWGDK